MILIVVALFWSTLSIFMGTENLSGKPEAIPKPVAPSQVPLAKGDADWVSWLGAKGDRRSGAMGIIVDWSGGLEKRWCATISCGNHTNVHHPVFVSQTPFSTTSSPVRSPQCLA